MKTEYLIYFVAINVLVGFLVVTRYKQFQRLELYEENIEILEQQIDSPLNSKTDKDLEDVSAL